MSPEVEPKHSKLTRFLCQELLYEYACGTLERRRRQDVDNYLAGCRDTQRELANLKKGMAYADSVSAIHVTKSLHQALLGFEPAWKKRLQAMTLWSSQRGWRVLPAFFLLLAVGLGLAVTKPWKTPRRQDTVLVVQRQNEPIPTEGAPTKAPPAPAPPSTVAAIAAPAAVVTPAAPVVTTPPTPAPTPVAAPIPAPAPIAAKPTPAPPVEVIKATEAAANDPTDEATSSRVDQPVSGGSGKGLIYRGDVTVTAFAANWPAIRDKIEELKGKAAGSVELGWLRHPTESYFHFTLPESNYSKLEEYLKSFGPVRIVKEHHPRVMPKGQIRIILTVKDGEPHENAAEAP